MRRPGNGTAPLAVAAAAAWAAAHSIVIYPGTIVWDGQWLLITLELDTHAMEHETRVLSPRASRQDLAAALARTLEVHTSSGRVLAPVHARAIGGGLVEIVFAIPPDTPALALRQRVDGPLAVLPRQWQLRWAPESAPARLIRLTAGGNVEVIRRAAPAATRFDSLTEPVLSLSARKRASVATPGSLASTDPDHLLIELDIPCALLPVWPGVLLTEAPIITDARLEAVQTLLADWTKEHLSLRNSQGEALSIRLSGTRLLTVDGAVVPRGSEAPHSVWTTRVRITATAPLPAVRREASLCWDGFTAAVQRLSAAYRAHSSMHRVTELTSADSQVLIRRSEGGQVLLLSAAHQRRSQAVEIPLRGDGAP